MKSIKALLFALTLTFTLAGCSSKEDDATVDTTTDTTVDNGTDSTGTVDSTTTTTPEATDTSAAVTGDTTAIKNLEDMTPEEQAEMIKNLKPGDVQVTPLTDEEMNAMMKKDTTK